MALYETLANNTFIEKDRVCRICYARAMGGIIMTRQEYSSRVSSFLEDCYFALGTGSTLSIIETFLTNLKFSTQLHDSHEEIKYRIDMIMSWLDAKHISPTVITMVITFLFILGFNYLMKLLGVLFRMHYFQ